MLNLIRLLRLVITQPVIRHSSNNNIFLLSSLQTFSDMMELLSRKHAYLVAMQARNLYCGGFVEFSASLRQLLRQSWTWMALEEPQFCITRNSLNYLLFLSRNQQRPPSAVSTQSLGCKLQQATTTTTTSTQRTNFSLPQRAPIWI